VNIYHLYYIACSFYTIIVFCKSNVDEDLAGGGGGGGQGCRSQRDGCDVCVFIYKVRIP